MNIVSRPRMKDKQRLPNSIKNLKRNWKQKNQKQEKRNLMKRSGEQIIFQKTKDQLHWMYRNLRSSLICSDRLLSKNLKLTIYKCIIKNKSIMNKRISHKLPKLLI